MSVAVLICLAFSDPSAGPKILGSSNPRLVLTRVRESFLLNGKTPKPQRQRLLWDAGHRRCQQPAAYDDADAGAPLRNCGDGLAGAPGSAATRASLDSR